MALEQAAHAGEPSEAERRAAAEAIYTTASALMTKGDFASACPKFEEVVKLQPNGVGARLTLADCYVGQGKLASAQTTYGQVASMAALANQPDRLAVAKEKADALAPKVSKLSIVVTPEVAGLSGLTVMRGGLVVSASLFNLAVPVDGGEYTIVADAEGKRPFTRTVKVAAQGAKQEVVINFEPLPSGNASGPGALQTSNPAVPPEQPEQPRDGGGMAPVRIGGIVIGAVGLVMAGIGLGVGVERSSKATDYQTQHDAPGTSERDRQVLSDAYVEASTQANVGWALTGIGGAAAAAGLIMILVAPDEDPIAQQAPATSAVTLHLAPGAGSLWLRGVFQ